MKTTTYEKLAIEEIDSLTEKYPKLSREEIAMLIIVMSHKTLEWDFK